MAARTFKLKNATAAGYGTLTEATATAGTMNTGWTVGTTTANAFSTMLFGTTRAANTFTTGVDQLSTQAQFDPTEAWRTDLPIDGAFSSGTNWSLAFSMIAVSTAASQTGRIKVRLWKSSDPTGATANQIQLTIATAAGMVTGTTAAFTKATAGVSTVTWTPTGIPAFSSEYLFVSPEWNTVVAGTRAGCDAIFVATAASAIITSDFTPATVQSTGSDSLTLSETITAIQRSLSTAADALVLVDTRTGQSLLNSTAADNLTLLDTQLATSFTGAIIATGSDSLTLVDTSTANRFTNSTAADTLTLTEARSGITTTLVSASDAISLLDTQSAIQRTQIFISETVSLSDTQNFIGGAVTVTGAITDIVSLSDTQDASVISGQIIDTHDGVRKKKKKKPLDFSEEVGRRERIRQQIQEVIHPTVIPVIPYERPAEKTEVKPVEIKTIPTPLADYAGLAKREIVAKIQKDTQERTKIEKERLIQAERQRLEDAREEEEFEEILMELL